jgi:uncharacterized protein YecA (UPF0149 family)
MMATSQNLSMFANQPTQNLEFSGAAKEMHKEAAGRNTVDLVHEKAKDESGDKVGRNDPCPCGAKKSDGTPVKYKNCHGK